VLTSHFGRLAKYQHFLETVINKRLKQRYVPLTSAGSTKEGRKLALAPEFYDQVWAGPVLDGVVVGRSTVTVTWLEMVLDTSWPVRLLKRHRAQ
jgi:hypothetical protein